MERIAIPSIRQSCKFFDLALRRSYRGGWPNLTFNLMVSTTGEDLELENFMDLNHTRLDSQRNMVHTDILNRNKRANSKI